MVKSRDYNKTRYVVAGVITFVIFILGVLLGLVVENLRVDYITQREYRQRIDYESLQLQYMYMSRLKDAKDCTGLSETLGLYSKNLESIRLRIEEYEKDSLIKRSDFSRLKREYTIAQLRYWLLHEEIDSICELDSTTIIYFYTDEEICPDCSSQAFILTYLKKMFGSKLLNFAIDEGFEQEPMINVLKSNYNITEYPSLIVNNKLYSGLTSRDDLLKIICDKLNEKIGDCE